MLPWKRKNLNVCLVILIVYFHHFMKKHESYTSYPEKKQYVKMKRIQFDPVVFNINILFDFTI